MSLNEISLAVAVVGGLVAAGVAVFEYRLRSQAQRAELDIRLAQLFAEIVPIANGRGEAMLSEEAVKAALEAGEKPGDVVWATSGHVGVGTVTQSAAVRSIGYLGSEYDALRGPAEQALTSLKEVFAGTADLETARQAALEDIRAAT